jgi:hypothetical protein
MDHLPGSDLIQRGNADLLAEKETPEALLVSIGPTRLRTAGVEVPPPSICPSNALVRSLVSFERTARRAT